MAPSKSSNLMKAGTEGFAMLDDYFRQKGGSKKPPPPPQQQQQQQYMHKLRHQPKPHVVQVIVPVPEAKETVLRIDCYEAAKIYGGTVVAEYSNTNKPPMHYMP